jgi:hypothetical protein
MNMIEMSAEKHGESNNRRGARNIINGEENNGKASKAL